MGIGAVFKWAAIGLGGVMLLGAIAGPPDNKVQPISIRDYPPPPRHPDVVRADSVLLEKLRAKRAGFGVVAEISFTMRNTGTSTVRDIEIGCDFTGQSGTTIASVKRVAYRAIPAGKSEAVRDMNFGFVPQEAVQFTCRVLRAPL
jgi:hypothetical protein